METQFYVAPTIVSVPRMGSQRFDQGTHFADTPSPNYAKSWLDYVNRREHFASVDTFLSLSHFGISGAGLNPCRFLYDGGSAPGDQTKIPIDALMRVLFSANAKVCIKLQSPHEISGLEDMNVAYLACTTLIFNGDIYRHPTLRLGLTDQERLSRGSANVRIAARQVAEFLNITLEELGRITGIGRTTFSSWHTKKPRPSTLRRLNRVIAFVNALCDTMGNDRTRAWLHSGEPSPISLLQAGELEAAEELAAKLIFRPLPASPSASIAPDEQPLPRVVPTGRNELPAANRAIRGGLDREHR